MGNTVALGTAFLLEQNGIPLFSFTATSSPGLGGRKIQKLSWLLMVVKGWSPLLLEAAFTNEVATKKRLATIPLPER